MDELLTKSEHLPLRSEAEVLAIGGLLGGDYDRDSSGDKLKGVDRHDVEGTATRKMSDKDNKEADENASVQHETCTR